MVTFRAKNALGQAERKFKIVCGDTLALTPHMGWNSWYIHYHRVTGKVMRVPFSETARFWTVSTRSVATTTWAWPSYGATMVSSAFWPAFGDFSDAMTLTRSGASVPSSLVQPPQPT